MKNVVLLKFVPKGPTDINPALVSIMAWHRMGDKPLSELEMKGCVISTVATDAIVLNNQAISILKVDQISITLDQFQTKTFMHTCRHKYIYIYQTTSESEIKIKKRPSFQRVKSTGGSDR